MIAIDMEMPKNCGECNLWAEIAGGINCLVTETYLNGFEDEDLKIPKKPIGYNCPLKPMKLHRKCKRVDLYEVEK